MRVFYSPSYVLAAHSFDTTRKAAWIADSLITHPFPGVTVEAPTPLTVSDIEVVHDHMYVNAIRTGTPLNYAESQGFTWDAGLWDMVCASNGGVVDAYSECDNAIPWIIRRPENYLPAVQEMLDTCHGDSGLVLYNAGMDPYQGDGTGGLHGIDYDMLNERERMVFQWCAMRGVPVAFVLAGGYTGAVLTKGQLVGLHRLTVGNAARILK